ncbi:hypothetical protein GGR02_001512 [Anoxybacillus voinovskiensis]|uniref:6-hydroxymethylpterin diphosphokinase MptE-like domain-containing protein n=1 Tax=Anoxybacteroides voinovskiense TaxID=230470 RepID=A0A840DLK0_9BACL|nr:6-hydroxymethylpterin diphosphokinase MptE-like protein [Anoxybacillus voinovskiensis]MBB4073750.1 hypothetical protein [Anoxybacillus voinovskiensis]GGJ64204.1 hypothetical protein GCM10008982_11800 [Anoxybacillus voinovskiensis]
MKLIDYNIAILFREHHNNVIDLHHVPEDVVFKEIQNDKEIFFNAWADQTFEVIDQLEGKPDVSRHKRELVIIIGVNNLREIETIVANGNPNSFYLVYEPMRGFFKHVCEQKDMTIFNRDNVCLVHVPLERLKFVINELFSTTLIFLTANIRFHLTHPYRTYLLPLSKKIVNAFSLVLRTIRWGFGNSIYDCLEGSTQNIHNIKYMFRSKDVRKLKKRFANVPAIIVSAGPSLDKNIHHLHKAVGKAIIIATETILERLVREGIIPDFVTSIERVQSAYELSYKGKKYPKEVTLVAPAVIKPMIFEEFQGNWIMPLRDGIGEYEWLDRILSLGPDAFVSMGDSTAHLALGFAHHLGANPIILIGQDLAFGEGGTGCHASGTIYEQIGTNPLDDPMQDPTKTVEGYYGGEVVTSELWLAFKKWFEFYIEYIKEQTNVINATEGGAKIEGTVQMPLLQAIEQYCQQEINVYSIVEQTPMYQFNRVDIIEKLKTEKAKIVQVEQLVTRFAKEIDGIVFPENEDVLILEQIIEKMKKADEILLAVYDHKLLFHNMQPELVNTFYKMYKIDEILSLENVKKNIDVQKDFLRTLRIVLDALIDQIDRTITELSKELGK